MGNFYEAIELPFRVVNGVGLKKGVLVGCPDRPWAKGSFWEEGVDAHIFL